MDLAAHLEHLQTVLKEFNTTTASIEEVLICYFCDGLRAFIRSQTNERARDWDTWEEAIEKAIDVEAKAACQPKCLMNEMHMLSSRLPAYQDWWACKKAWGHRQK